jgi:hypothetical protein
MNKFGPRNSSGFEFTILGRIQIKEKHFVTGSAHRPVAQNGMVVTVDPRPACACQAASQHTVTVLTIEATPTPVNASHHRPTWVSGLIPVHGHRKRTPAPFCFPLTMTSSRSRPLFTTVLLAVTTTGPASPSTLKPAKCFAVVSSSCSISVELNTSTNSLSRELFLSDSFLRKSSALIDSHRPTLAQLTAPQAPPPPSPTAPLQPNEFRR